MPGVQSPVLFTIMLYCQSYLYRCTYLYLWVCWPVPVYLPNLGRTGEGQNQTVTSKHLSWYEKQVPNQGVFCHCSLLPTFSSFLPCAQEPSASACSSTSPLPSGEDSSMCLSCPPAGLVARAPVPDELLDIKGSALQGLGKQC